MKGIVCVGNVVVAVFVGSLCVWQMTLGNYLVSVIDLMLMLFNLVCAWRLSQMDV